MTTNYPPSGIGLKDSDRLLTKVGTSGMPTSNWFNFKPRLLNLADLYDLLAIFETGITITTTTEDEKARTAQLAKDKLARHLLMNSICDGGPLDLIKGCTTARDMWLKLIARFEVNTLAHEMLLRNQISSKKFLTGGSLDEHIDGLIRLRDELQAMGVGSEFSDAHMAKTLLSSMPYEDFATVIDSLDDSAVKLDLNTVRLRLQSRHSRLMDAKLARQSKITVPAAAFVSTSVPSSTLTQYAPCQWCGKTGHASKYCYEKWTKEVVLQRKAAAAAPFTSGRPAAPASLVAVNSSDSVAVTPHQPAPMGFMFTAHVSPTVSTALSSMTMGSKQRVAGWVLDSGASHHFCYEFDKFINYTTLDSPILVQLGGSSDLHGVGFGNVLITYLLHGRPQTATLRNALYVPDANFNLLSIGVLDEAGMDVRFCGGVCQVASPAGVVMLSVHREKGSKLYRLLECASTPLIDDVPSEPPAVSCLRAAVSADLLHARLGHVNCADMKRLVSMADGVTYIGQVSSTCIPCIMTKQQRASIPNERTTHTERVLELVHCDIAGPFPVKGLHGERYFVVLIDDYSCMCFVRLLKSRDEILQVFIDWKLMVENQTNKKIKTFRSDGAMEFQSHDFSKVLTDSGILRQISAPYTQAQNGKSERSVRTISEYGRAMLYFSGLPLSFWSAAVEHAAYLRNRLPTRALPSCTPFEVWTGQRPDLSNVRVFGCRAFAHIPDERRKKLDVKSRECLYLGVPSGVKGFRLYDIEKMTVFASAHVVFDESFSHVQLSEHGSLEELFDVDDIFPLDASPPSQIPGTLPVLIEAEPQVDTSEIPVAVDPFNNEPAAASPAAPRRSGRERHIPDRFVHTGRLGDHFGVSADATAPSAQLSAIATPEATARSSVEEAGPVAVTASIANSLKDISPNSTTAENSPYLSTSASNTPAAHDIVPDYEQLFSAGFALVSIETPLHGEPSSYKQAINRPDAEAWLAAMKDEYQSLVGAGTFVLVSLPPGANLITCRWVYKVKLNPDGSVNRYKARLVARGFTQRHGIDYTHTFAPVVKFQSIRALLAIAAAEGWVIHQMDVITAYLNGELEHEIYMAQPEGFIEEQNKGLVCSLKKSLYGLKQAGRAWNKKIHEVLTGLGFVKMEADHCVYQFIDRTTVIWLCLYVDDLLLFSNQLPALVAFKARLSNQFKMKDLGEAEFVLGIAITRDRTNRTISINQSAYLRSVLARFRQENAKPAYTPLDAGARLLKSDCPADDSDEQIAMRNVPYLQAVGAIMFLMLATRPDIAFAITKLAQFSHNPGMKHWRAVQRLLRYLRGTEHLAITYGGIRDVATRDLAIVGYCDADWGSDADDRRSTTGYVFLINNGAVSWQAKKQPTVAQSSVEAEYMAMSQATKELMWWSYLLKGLGQSFPVPCPIFSDSQGAISLVDQPSSHSKSKHIDIRHHYIRELSERGIVIFNYMPTQSMPADLLTKALTRDVHARLVVKFGLTVLSSRRVAAIESTQSL